MENPYIPRKLPPCEEIFPSHKQATFLSYFGREAFYGGAAGGGKSAALLAGALQFIESPGYEALLCRRVHKHLTQSDGLIPKFHEWMRLTGNTKRVKWNTTEKQAVFPNGSTLSFGYCDHERDLDSFQGGRWHYIGIDELSQWKENYYTYLFSRQRKPKESPIPIRIRAGGNPGNIGHEWIKKRYISPDAVKYFVRATLQDNPGVDAVDYVQSMAELDPVTRAQLLAGDWDAYQGGRFRSEWFGEFSVIYQNGQPVYALYDKHGRIAKTYPASLCWNFVICDPAARAEEVNDYTAIGAFAVMPSGEVLILEVVRVRISVEDIVPRIARVCGDYSPMWVGIEDSGFQITILNAARRHPGIPAVMPLSPEGKSKLVRGTPAIIMASEGMIYLPVRSAAHPWIEDFVAELIQFTGDPAMDAHDDQCLAAGTIIATAHGDVPIEDIRAGDLVLTRKGFREVTAAIMTNDCAAFWQIVTAKGLRLIGTKNHQVFANNSFVRIDELAYGDKVQKPSFAEDRVALVTNTHAKGRVYNLSVDGENEYFANGILVHNCDVLSYAIQAMNRHGLSVPFAITPERAIDELHAAGHGGIFMG